MLSELLIFTFSLVAIWVGSGFIVSSVNKFASHLKVSAFALSFTLLGILTSIPEFSVGVNAVLEDRPDIFIGNLIGASAALFFFIIPTVAIVGKGVKLNNGFHSLQLAWALLVILAPALLTFDARVTPAEGGIMLVAYFLLSAFLPHNLNFFQKIRQRVIQTILFRNWFDDLRFLAGIIIVFISSRYLVDTTIQLAGIFHIPAIIISMFALAIGTNLPELVLGVRSIALGNKDIAFGDYVGSAAANTLIFGFLVLLTGWTIVLPPWFWMNTVLAAVGYCLFWYLASSHRELTRKEGAIMLGLYALLLFIQFVG